MFKIGDRVEYVGMPEKDRIPLGVPVLWLGTIITQEEALRKEYNAAAFSNSVFVEFDKSYAGTHIFALDSTNLRLATSFSDLDNRIAAYCAGVLNV